MSIQPQLYRAQGLLELDKIAATKMVVVGVGSLGSRVIDLMTPLPWRELVLIDPDLLEEVNIERHVLGRSALGRPKVLGMAEWLRDRDMSRVVTHYARVEDCLDLHQDTDLIIITTGGFDIPSWVSIWNEDPDIPMIVAQVSVRANGGDVRVLPKPSVVCFNCIEAWYPRQEAGDLPLENYGYSEEELPPAGVAGLRWSIAEIASQTVGFALHLVQRGLKAQLITINHGWETLMVIPKGGGKWSKTVQRWARSQAELGFEPTIRLVSDGDHNVVQARMGDHVTLVQRWTGCPFHDDQ